MDKEKTYKAREVMSMLEQINDGIEVIGEQHGELVTEIKSINGRLDSMQDDITEIKHKLSEKVDREEFNKLENRVVKMEKLLLAKSA